MGKLIVLEGTDGVGKSTQFSLLKNRLAETGLDFRTVVFPQYSEPSSALIRMYLGGEQVGAINKVLDQYKNWCFVLAFTSIGLDTNFKEIAKQMQGGKVLWLYIVGQVFNIALTLFAVWFLLSGVVFQVPVLDLFKE